MENQANQAKGDLDPNLKFALAIAVLGSKRRQKLLSSSSATTADTVSNANGAQAFCDGASESDAIKWKRKAKQRKQQILRLKEDLKLAEDGIQQDVYPQNVSCKCYFFDNLGDVSPKHCIDGFGSDRERFSDVLRRRFLRQVRLSERQRRRRLDGTLEQPCISDYASENKLEELRDSVDFLVELCETHSPLRVEDGNFKNWSHQAVDFILATFKALSSVGKADETVESILSSLIVRLMRRMCGVSQGDELQPSPQQFKFYIQHLLRKLGSEPYIGQRVILSVSQKISVVAESLLYMDPFDGAFPKMHNFMYIMIQLIEFLVSDYLLSWSLSQDFDTDLLEEWVASVFHARKALELLESRNGLYILFMDRVVGDLTRKMGQVSFLQKLRPDTLTKLFG